MKSISRREALTAGVAALTIAPLPAITTAAPAALPGAPHPDARLFELLRQYEEADRVLDRMLDARARGEMPTTDEALEPFIDATSDVEHAIMCEPANSVDGMLIKARVALQNSSPHRDWEAPATPAEAYEGLAEVRNFSPESWIESLWADIERLATARVS